MFYNQQGEKLQLGNIYKDQAVFLFGGGRSITPQHIQLARSTGVVTASLNEGGHYIRPNLYMATSGITLPHSVLSDPTIHKFIRNGRLQKQIYEDVGLKKKIGDYPNVTGFDLKVTNFVNFMSPDYVYSQEDSPKYMRNSAITLINILVKLGFTKIYLVGMDFYGQTGKCTYFYPRKYINDNINVKMIQRVKNTLDQMNHLDGVTVYNTNKRGGLKNLPYVDFEEAIAEHTVHYESDIYETFNDDRLIWGWDHFMGIDKSSIKNGK